MLVERGRNHRFHRWTQILGWSRALVWLLATGGCRWYGHLTPGPLSTDVERGSLSEEFVRLEVVAYVGGGLGDVGDLGEEAEPAGEGEGGGDGSAEGFAAVPEGGDEEGGAADVEGGGGPGT